MSYAEYTRNNKSKIKKFSHQKRFDVAIKLIDLNSKESLLDFGTGDGYLLERLFHATQNQNLYGYDPLDFMFEELKQTITKNNLDAVTITDNLDTITNQTFDVVSCLEVLEHFSEKDQRNRLLEIKNLVQNNGRIIVSVPLETGLSSLFKNSIRFFIGQNKEHATLKNIVKSFLGLKITRQEDGYIYTHIGFNHKNLEILIKNCGLKIINQKYSPFKYLYGFLNSQVYYILKK